MVSGSLYQQHAFFTGRLSNTFRKLYSLLIGISLGVLILSAKWESISQFTVATSAANHVTPVVQDAENLLVGAYRKMVWRNDR